MKTILLTLISFFIVVIGRSQVVLNEAYVEPGAGHEEFFELFNTSSSQVPENLNGYTIITYYEEGTKEGFYVLDLPDTALSARGYFVASCLKIFNIQGQSNNVADISWNNLATSSALTKWENTGTGYISRSIPPTLDDFFFRKNGGGANYTILIYKNGVLVNGLFGGTSSTTIPAFLKAMPNLPVDMIAPSVDFTVNFNSIANNQVEYVTAVPGTDNGYMRLYDGICGVWEKSSSQAQHTPGVTNGTNAGTLGTVIVTASVIKGLAPAPSYLSYKVTGGTASAYPVTVEAYRDFGTIGQLDADDIVFDSRVITSGSMGLQNISLVNPDDKVMIVVKSPAGCFDQVLRAYGGYPLPVKMESFTAFLINGKAQLKWTTTSEINLSHFVIEKSTDGINFSEIGVEFAYGNETDRTNYIFKDDNVSKHGLIYYRIRSVDNTTKSEYSQIRIIKFDNVAKSNIAINIYPNPVSNDARITIPANWQNKHITYAVYNANGQTALKSESNYSSQTETLNLRNLTPGIYIITVSCDGQTSQQKIIKN